MTNLKILYAPLLFMVILFLSSCSSSKWLSGNWYGMGEQIDGRSWAVDLNYSSLEDIKISYPDLACGGVWRNISRSKNLLVFSEDIQEGKLKCDQGCEVHVSKINKNTIKLVYFLRYYDPEDPIAEGTLNRINY